MDQLTGVSFTEVLFQLCETRNHESLAQLLDQQQELGNNCDDIINIRDPSGQTPLYAAVANQAAGCVRVLLEYGADPNYACSPAYFCRTALHYCAAEGSVVGIVELLLNNGAEPLLQDIHGDTCLALAIQYGHNDIHSLMSTSCEQRDQMFELIVNRMFYNDDIYQRFSNLAHLEFQSFLINGEIEAGKNCLHSIRNRRQTFLKHLSRHAVSIVIQCIENNSGDSIILLADAGVDYISLVIEPNGDNILHCAARLGADKAAAVILDRWPGLFCRTSALGRLPLHDACERGKSNIVRLFLNYQSFPRKLMITQQSPYGCYEFPVDVNHADVDSRTALLDACSSGSVDTVKALLEARFISLGSAMDSSNISITVNSPIVTETPVGSLSNYVSSLFRKMRVPSTTGSASGSGLPFSQSFQLGSGANLMTPNANRPARSGSTISLEDRSNLQTAFSDFEILSPQPKPTSPGGMFNPVDLNVFSYDKTTPLLTAIKMQNKAIAGLLLQSGADPELPGQWRGYHVTPLHAAVELRDGELVDLLLQSGAIDNDCAALESALKSAPHLVPVFLRRWSEIDREVQINVDSVAELAEMSRCRTDTIVPVAINWRSKPQLRDLPQAWLVGCALFHNPALILDDFVACSVITRLDISSNAIRVLPSYLFHMQSLQTLNASSNQIEEIAAGGIQRSFLSSSLREIDLSFNRLQTLPSFIFWLRRLNKIYADNNVINSLPSDLWDNSSLVELKLAHNRLENLPTKRMGRAPTGRSGPETVHIRVPEGSSASKNHHKFGRNSDMTKSELIELQQHDLWSLELSSEVGFIPDDNVYGTATDGQILQNCCGLRFVDLSHNLISMIPGSLVCLTPLLRTLNLSNNNISHINRWPSEFPPALHTLDLSFNKINTFAPVTEDSNPQKKTSIDVILPCANPVQLSPANLPIQERARSLCRPDSRRVRSRSADRRKGSDAERLYLASCNHRQHVSLARLRTLNLSNNAMVAFNFDSTSAPGITQLDLSSNRITALPQSICQLQNLSVLNLANTQLSTLPPELSRLNRLWSIEISNCPLTGELGSLARGKVRTADIIYHLRASLDRVRLRPITRLIVCGLPGSGKSSLIDTLKRAANTHTPPCSSHNPETNQPIIDWGQLTVEHRPDGPLTFRLSELSGKPDFRYVALNFLSHRCVVLIAFRLNEIPTSEIADALASLVRDVNLMIPSAPILLCGTFADVLAENIFESGAADVMPIWRRKLIAAFQHGDQAAPIRSASFSSNEAYDSPSPNNDPSGVDEVILPGNCKLIVMSTQKNRKKNGTRILKEAHRLAFEWRGGVSSLINRGNANPSQGSGFQATPTLKQTVPALFADTEIVVGKLASSLISAKRPPLLLARDFQEAVKQQLADLNFKSYRDLDELNQCIHFLHDIGLIVHFDEPSVADFYFLSIQWLSRLLADIIFAAANSTATKLGLLTLEDVAKVLALLEPSGILTCEKMIPLLARLDVAYSWEGGACMLVPGLLPKYDNPFGLELTLKQAIKSHKASFRMSLIERESGTSLQPSVALLNSSEHSLSGSSDTFSFDLNRFYLINHIPLNFWPRLIVRLLPCELLTEILTCINEAMGGPKTACPIIRIWDTRFELYASEQSASPSLIVEQIDRRHLHPGTLKWSLALSGQMLWSVSSSVSLISIRVPSAASISQPNLGARLLSLITEFIDQLLEDWYPAIGSRFAQDTLGSYLVYRLVPCQHCFAGNDLAMVPCFLLEECMAAVCQFSQIASTPTTSDNNFLSGSFVSSSLSCSKGHSIDVASVAPDLVFADIPTSQLIDCVQFLEKASLLGCGALGPVISVSLTKLQQQMRRSTLVSSTSSGGDSFFMTRSGSFGNASSRDTKSVAIKFFNPVDIDLSSISGPVTATHSLASQYRRLNDQLRRRFKADPIRLACEAYTNARQELSILLCLRHQHITSLIGVSLNPLGLILQLAPLGSLFDWLLNYRRVGQQLNSNTVIQVMAQISDALAYLHRMGVIYRDLKSSNVLVWRFPRPVAASNYAPNAFSDVSSSTDASSVLVRISDFSIARWCGGVGCRGQAGTPGFMAPEVIQFNGEETYTEKVDSFSFGMFLYELLTLRLPFEDRPSVNARHAVLAGIRPPPTLAMFTYGQIFTDLIAACWRKDPTLRPTASDIARISNWPGMNRVVSISSISGIPELLYASSIPSATGIRGAVVARWSAVDNRTHIESISFDGDECFALNRLAEHPPQEPNRKKNSPADQQVVMVNCLTLSSHLIFAADLAGLIHCYKLSTGEYLGCVPAGRTGCHAINLYCCNESTSPVPNDLGPLAASDSKPDHDTLLALYSNSLLVVLKAAASSNPVLAPISRFELDPSRGTVCCMAIIRRQFQQPSPIKSPSTGFRGPLTPPKMKESALPSKVNLFDKKTSSNKLKSFFTRPSVSEESEPCGPGVNEIWVGCFDGSILLCSPKSLSTPTRIRAPTLSSGNKEGNPGPPIAALIVDNTSESVFATYYLSSLVSRWSVRQRVLLAHFDFGEQITSIVPQNTRLLLGTISGCIIASDLSSLRPLQSFPLHSDAILALIPIGSNESDSTSNNDLIVSLGRGVSEPLSCLLPTAATSSRMCIVSLSFSN